MVIQIDRRRNLFLFLLNRCPLYAEITHEITATATSGATLWLLDTNKIIIFCIF